MSKLELKNLFSPEKIGQIPLQSEEAMKLIRSKLFN